MCLVFIHRLLHFIWFPDVAKLILANLYGSAGLAIGVLNLAIVIPQVS